VEPPDRPHTIQLLEDHLAAQALLQERADDFDMNDEPEFSVLEAFHELQTAIMWLTANVTPRWREADREALRSQTQHRNLARVAILAGTFAIVLSVIQLALRLTSSRYVEMAGYVELIIVGIAGLAVLLGVIAKFDRRWLTQRNTAERLRMLKFRALEQLSCRDPAGWQNWVEGRLISLKDTADFTSVKRWSREGEVEPEVQNSPKCESDTAQALTTYYRHKRLLFQANYFNRRKEQYERQTSGRRHLSLIFFLVSVFLAFVHFLADPLSDSFRDWGHQTTSTVLELLAVWSAAFAAIIPISGLGIRAWFAAFQLPLSASIYEAKNHALLHAANGLDSVSEDFEGTLYHIAHIEQFLRDEHREWLRLLLETEWFL
jgi:hypothetical protein